MSDHNVSLVDDEYQHFPVRLAWFIQLLLSSTPGNCDNSHFECSQSSQPFYIFTSVETILRAN